MKRLIFSTFVLLALGLIPANAQTYTYKVITSVESIVPSGLGRSRLISANDGRNYEDYTSTQSSDSKGRNKSKRSNMRVKGFDETKLLNFYNVAGIRFQNIATNDALVTSKINTMSADGWELAFVTSAVESDAGKGDGKGIFITRYVFKKRN